MRRYPRSPLVVHCEREEFDVYVGRPSPFGNPFREGPFVSRSQAISRYEKWLKDNPELMERVRRELRGKRLGCFCRPKACHGDVLAMVAEEDP